MASYVRKRLEVMGDRVNEGVEKCKGLVEKLGQEHLLTDSDRTEINKLKTATNRLLNEIQTFTFQHQGPSSEEMEDFIAELTSVQIHADDLLVELGVDTQTDTNLTSQNQTRDSTVSAPANITSRLPKLDLPKFDGNILNWHEFWSKFTASIDGRVGLNDVDKLTYLQIAVSEGKAKDLIAGLATTDEAYKIAVDTLMDEYGEKGIVIDAHYTALFEVPRADRELRDNKRVLSEIDRHLRILDALGENTGQNNAIRAMIVAKFSETVQSNLCMKLKPTQETVANIMGELKTIIKALEHYSAPAHATEQNRNQPNGSGFTTEALYVQGGNGQQNPNNHKRKGRPDQQPGKRRKFDRSQSNYSGTGNKVTSEPKHTDKSSGTRRPSGDKGGNDGKATQRLLRCIFCQGSHTHESCSQYKTLKERKAKLTGRCFICLRGTHNAQNCPSADRFCPHCGTKGHHNRCLCPEKYGKKETVANFAGLGTDTLLQTVLAPIGIDAANTVKAKILFDCGSQRSYIQATLAKRLKLAPLEKTRLTVFTFGSTKPKSIPADLVTIPIGLRDGIVEVMAYVVPSTTGLLPSHSEFKKTLYTKFPHLNWAEDSDEDRSADIIVGNDFYYKFILNDRKEIAHNLHLVKTGFGWIPSGSFSSTARNTDYQLSVLTYVEGRCICSYGEPFILPDPAIRQDNVRMLWELEAIGITDPPKALQDEEVIEYFNRTTQFIENRYYVKWPWVEYPPNITPNYGLALGRLQSLLKRLDKDQRHRYNDVLTDQFQRGIIEEITDTKLPQSHPVHYLPHHCVIQEHKSTKLRIVYDASSKVKGQCSLNELLYKGPLMLIDLTTMILKFRTHSIGLVADIEKAFLQIGLQTEDRDVTRFLWVRDISRAPSDDNIIHMRFCRVPFGIISSPYLLAATIRHHFLSKERAFANTLASCLYVDNLVTGVETSVEADKLYHTAVETMKELSMNLRSWNSNDKIFLDTLQPSHRDEESIITVLGVIWDTVNDHMKLAFDASKLNKPATTKREVLSIIASVFDPCGFVAPLTLPTRIFLQRLWTKGLNWDTPLSQEQRTAWEACVIYLQRVPQFAIPRRFVPVDLTKHEPLDLHCFTDASLDAYVAVVYIRTKHYVSYVISKSRVTPLQRKANLTIPKLELLAVVIGTRLLSFVRQALDLAAIASYLWTDNQAVLGWLHTERLLPPWVSRRVGEVQKASNITYRYVPSALNPADIATRPLLQESIPRWWLTGPEFLLQPVQFWPTQQMNMDNTADISEDTERDDVTPNSPAHVVLNNTGTSANWELPSRGWTLPQPAVLDLQRTHFADEYAGKETQLSKKLGIFRDEHGVLRCKGRYQNAAFTYEQRCPIILPKDSELTSWVIRQIHVENYHVGSSHTLSLLRHQYWIPQGRSAVSKVLKRCPECVKYGGGPFRLPRMPDLPQERLSYSPPFTYTGLDYLGPLLVTEKGSKHKRWVCLFTCMAVRAIHLEVVENLSAEEFVLCLRRFAATRGTPNLLLSDNATQFKLVSTVLASTVVRGQKIEWRFITELSPWQGGLYERLVGLVKHCLLRAVDKALLSDSQLRTIMKEIEDVLNTRPLTTVGPDHEVVLTPSHFLRTCGPSGIQCPERDPHEFSSDIQRRLVEGWKKSCALLGDFQHMFMNQYLLSLRERHTPSHKQPRVLSYRDPTVGDLVQVKGDGHNRALWRVGKITGLRTGSDGQVRSAQVTLDNGVIINRSVGHLYPLELDIDHSEQPVRPGAAGVAPLQPNLERPNESDAITAPTAPEPSPTPASPSPASGAAARPQRAAASQARQRIRQWTANLFSLASSSLLPAPKPPAS